MIKEQLKIAMVTETFLPKVGGQQIFVDGLASWLAKRGHDVTVVCPKYPQDDYITRVYKIKRIFGSSLFTFLLSQNNFKLFLKENPFDLIHAHNPFPTGLLCYVFSRDIPLVITSHSPTILPFEFNSWYYENFIAKKLAVYALNRAHVHIAPSNYILEHAIKLGAKRENARIIRNFYFPQNNQETNNRKRLKADKRIPFNPKEYYVFIGRLHPKKRVDLLIKAVAKSNSKLVIVGDGPQKPILTKLVNELKIQHNVYFAGIVVGKAKLDILRQAKAALFASTSENHSLSLIEAMAVGTLPIVAYKPFYTEFVDSSFGLIFKNFLELVKILKQLDENTQLKVNTQLLQQEAAKYSLEKVGRQYEELFYSLKDGQTVR